MFKVNNQSGLSFSSARYAIASHYDLEEYAVPYPLNGGKFALQQYADAMADLTHKTPITIHTLLEQIIYSSEHGYSSPVLTTYTLEDGRPVSATALFPDGSTESASDDLEAQSWFEYDSMHGTLISE